MQRRNFLNILMGWTAAASVASVLYPIFRFLRPTKGAGPEITDVDVCKVADLQPNTARVFQFGERAGILVKAPDGELKAFDATCTHLGCTVQYRPEKGDLWCACHDGVFDLNGKNISGPPPKPLVPFKVTIQKNDITVSKA